MGRQRGTQEDESRAKKSERKRQKSDGRKQGREMEEVSEELGRAALTNHQSPASET